MSRRLGGSAVTENSVQGAQTGGLEKSGRASWQRQRWTGLWALFLLFFGGLHRVRLEQSISSPGQEAERAQAGGKGWHYGLQIQSLTAIIELQLYARLMARVSVDTVLAQAPRGQR